jgi:Protein of unknown function (DUF1648)
MRSLPFSEPPVARTRLERALQFLSTLSATGYALYWGFNWNGTPERVPRHFGFDGQPDAWGGPGMLWLLPTLAFGVFLGLTILERFPHLFNYPIQVTPLNRAALHRFGRQSLLWVKTLVVLAFWYITAAAIETSRGNLNGLGAWFAPSLLVAGSVGVCTALVKLSRLAAAPEHG